MDSVLSQCLRFEDHCLKLSISHQATVLCDIVVLYCMKKKYYYREKKYKYVEDYELVSINEGRVEAKLLPSLTVAIF